MLGIQGNQLEIESGFTRSIIDELHSLDTLGDQMEGERGVSRGCTDELHFSDIQVIKWKAKVV